MIHVLDDANTRSLIGSGCESFCRGPVRLVSWMGDAHGIYSWDNTLVMGSLDSESFWVGSG